MWASFYLLYTFRIMVLRKMIKVYQEFKSLEKRVYVGRSLTKQSGQKNYVLGATVGGALSTNL